MVLTDDDNPDLHLPANYAFEKAYYVPRPRVEAAARAHRLVPVLQTVSQQCTYANPAQCAKRTSRNTCNQTPGCAWNTTAGPEPTCLPTSCQCTVVAEPALSQCARIREGVFCQGTPGCHWDAEFAQCLPDARLWNVAAWCALLVPAAYLLCYTLFNRAHVTRMWAPYGMMGRGVYVLSMVLTAAAFVFLGVTITLTRKHVDNRWWFAGALFLVVAGATMAPVFRALWLVSDWSVFWVLLALAATSAGTIWLVSEYVHRSNNTPDAKERRATTHTPWPSAANAMDFAGTLSAYYILFHVVFVDNLLWWLVFWSAGK